MRIFKIAPILILMISAGGLNVNGQCKAFAKKNCLPELGSYTHDGNYHATVLAEGEEAELYKTFYSDMEYRLSICGDEALPPVEFLVLDVNRNILFSSKESNNAKTWDFKLQSSQQLKIVIKVGSTGQQNTTPASGCVAIMFGFKIKS
jgi:hypothetical protein